MVYKVVVIENDQESSDNIISNLKKSSNFNFVASYKDVNAAISQSEMFQPDLFLINVDDKESLNMIPAFVDIFPNSNILGFVSQWVPDISKEMQRVRALGCITKPFTAGDVLEALRIYKLRGKKGLARVVSFFSPKGRAGRTTMASILALALAAKSGERVALIDADLQFGDIPIFFDVEPEQTVIDAARDVRLLTPLNVEPYFYNIKKNLYMLSSPEKPEYAELVDIQSMVDFVRLSSNVFRYVIMDLPAGFNPLSIGLSRLADTVVMMAMINNGFEIQHLRRALEIFDSNSANSQKKVYPILSRVNPCTDEEKRKIELKLGYSVRNIMPNEYRMISIANSGRLSRDLPMESLLIKNISEIADEMISEKW